MRSNEMKTRDRQRAEAMDHCHDVLVPIKQMAVAGVDSWEINGFKLKKLIPLPAPCLSPNLCHPCA